MPVQLNAQMKIIVVLALLMAVAGGMVGLYALGQANSHVNLDTPVKAAGTFFACLRAGHDQDVLDCVVEATGQQELASQLASLVSSGTDPGDLTMLPRLDAGDLEKATLIEDGDTVTLELPADAFDDPVKAVDRPRRVVLRREGSDYRVDLLATTGMTAEQAIELARRLATAQVEAGDDTSAVP